MVTLEWPWENFSWAPLEIMRDIPAPEGFLHTKLLTIAVCVCCISFAWGSLFYLTRWLRVTRQRYEAQRRVNRSLTLVWWIRTNILFEALGGTCCGLVLLANVNHASGQWMCIIGSKFSSLFYVLGAWSSYRILLLRAKTTIVNQSRGLKVLFKVCEFANTYIVPCIASLVLVFFQPAFLFERHCALFVRPTLMWMFTIADTSLSVSLLALFAVPLLLHIRSIQSSGMTTEKMQRESHRMRKKVSSDLKIGIIHVFSTFCVMATGASLTTFVELNQNTAYLRIGDLIGYMLDMFVNAQCMLAITSVWRPRRLHARVFMALTGKSGRSVASHSSSSQHTLSEPRD
mmetsp:Transcript_9546/g.30581  ORF Transcript_9546/g.30581 Transcript_9546/m.30581 type:complete len:344 (+) Transcript_9546:110-1141(+)